MIHWGQRAGKASTKETCDVNYCQLKQTASRGTHDLTASTLRPVGPHRAWCSTEAETW